MGSLYYFCMEWFLLVLAASFFGCILGLQVPKCCDKCAIGHIPFIFILCPSSVGTTNREYNHAQLSGSNLYLGLPQWMVCSILRFKPLPLSTTMDGMSIQPFVVQLVPLFTTMEGMPIQPFDVQQRHGISFVVVTDVTSYILCCFLQTHDVSAMGWRTL